MNTIRNFFPQEIERLRPLLGSAYRSILEYQTRREAKSEAALRAAIRKTLPILQEFKPHIPLYKQQYIRVLEGADALAPYNLIVCFDRAVYELHTRLECGQWAHLPWSQALNDLLDERRQPEAPAPPGRPETFLASGLGVTRGAAEGTARLVCGRGEYDRLQSGDILVTRMTDPDFILVADRIAGLVTDQGGRLCHAAILAREWGIPCVVGCRDATLAITDGQRIRLDAISGIVTGRE